MNAPLKLLSGLAVAAFTAACGGKVIHAPVVPLASMPEACEALTDVGRRTNGDAINCLDDLGDEHRNLFRSFEELAKGNPELAVIRNELNASLSGGKTCQDTPGATNCLPAASYQICVEAVKLIESTEARINLLDPKAPLDKTFGADLGAYMAANGPCTVALAEVYGQVAKARPVVEKVREMARGYDRASLLLKPR